MQNQASSKRNIYFFYLTHTRQESYAAILHYVKKKNRCYAFSITHRSFFFQLKVIKLKKSTWNTTEHKIILTSLERRSSSYGGHVANFHFVLKIWDLIGCSQSVVYEFIDIFPKCNRNARNGHLLVDYEIKSGLYYTE